jgi:hypothetical protein
MADKSGWTPGSIVWKVVMAIVALWLVYWMLRTYVL